MEAELGFSTGVPKRLEIVNRNDMVMMYNMMLEDNERTISSYHVDLNCSFLMWIHDPSANHPFLQQHSCQAPYLWPKLEVSNLQRFPKNAVFFEVLREVHSPKWAVPLPSSLTSLTPGNFQKKRQLCYCENNHLHDKISVGLANHANKKDKNPSSSGFSNRCLQFAQRDASSQVLFGFSSVTATGADPA